jgi:hypothetical protein
MSGSPDCSIAEIRPPRSHAGFLRSQSQSLSLSAPNAASSTTAAERAVVNRRSLRHERSPVAVGEQSVHPGFRTTRRTRPPPPSALEYTPARSADKHLPEAHWRSPSILSPAVTATGTTFWAA